MIAVTEKSDNCQLLEMLVFSVIWVTKKGREIQMQIQKKDRGNSKKTSFGLTNIRSRMTFFLVFFIENKNND